MFYIRVLRSFGSAIAVVTLAALGLGSTARSQLAASSSWVAKLYNDHAAMRAAQAGTALCEVYSLVVVLPDNAKVYIESGRLNPSPRAFCGPIERRPTQEWKIEDVDARDGRVAYRLSARIRNARGGETVVRKTLVDRRRVARSAPPEARFPEIEIFEADTSEDLSEVGFAVKL